MEAAQPREPELAESILVVIKGNTGRVYIDGVEFPWFIAEDGVQVMASTSSPGEVRLTLLADSVVLINDSFDQ